MEGEEVSKGGGGGITWPLERKKVVQRTRTRISRVVDRFGLEIILKIWGKMSRADLFAFPPLPPSSTKKK